MLDVNFLENYTEEAIKRLDTRNSNYRAIVEKIVKLNQIRKTNLVRVEHCRAQKNQLTESIRNLVHNSKNKAKLKSEIEAIKKEIAKLDAEIEVITKELDFLNQEIRTKNSNLPNLPAVDVPIGKDESDNVEVKKVNKKLISNHKNLAHWEIAKQLGWVDFELGAKLSGSRFLVYCGLGAKMIRVLADVLLNFHAKNGYTEFNVPLIVNQSAMEGTGQLPKFADDAYQVGNQYLIPTGEVPLTNFVAHDLLSYKQLPLNFTTFTPCFRQEAGSAGRDTKGMIRLHQFNKVELVKIVAQEQGETAFESLVHEVSGALNLFKLPYRIVNLSTGDLGFSSMKTYDFEVWLPHQQTYREISSCSLCGDFQARNMQARYRDENGKTKFVYTLNGSGVAIDRLFAAILENYWDGEKLLLPKVLQPYFENCEYLK